MNAVSPACFEGECRVFSPGYQGNSTTQRECHSVLMYLIDKHGIEVAKAYGCPLITSWDSDLAISDQTAPQLGSQFGQEGAEDA